MVQYDSAWTYKNLELIPVKFKTPSGGTAFTADAGIITFKDALHSGKISVKEMMTPEGSDVNVLLVKNHSNKKVLVNSGEILAGGKQDRAVALTAIIPAEEEFYLPVFCIEKGRWADKIKSFTYAGNVDAALKKQMDVAKKQKNVWKEIDRQFREKGTAADTWPYLKLYNDTIRTDTGYWHFFKTKMMQSDSAFAGFVAISGGHIINCELFSNTQLCLLSYEGLINSYVHAIAETGAPPAVAINDIKKFPDKFLKTKEQQQKYLASHGRIDKYQNNIIHIVAYDDE